MNDLFSSRCSPVSLPNLLIKCQKEELKLCLTVCGRRVWSGVGWSTVGYSVALGFLAHQRRDHEKIIVCVFQIFVLLFKHIIFNLEKIRPTKKPESFLGFKLDWEANTANHSTRSRKSLSITALSTLYSGPPPVYVGVVFKSIEAHMVFRDQKCSEGRYGYKVSINACSGLLGRLFRH